MYRGLVVALVTVLCGASAAHADSVVVEAYGGERPKQAEALLAPVIAELESRGFVAGGALTGKIDDRLSREAQILGFDRINDAKRFIDSGRKQFQSGNFDTAIKELELGLAPFRDAPATLVKRQELRDDRFVGLLYLALAHKRKRDQGKATQAMAELIRSFQDKDVSQAKYGPEARTLYRAIKRDLEDQGTGTLAIKVDDARSVVFVNERYIGGGSQTVRDLPAGRYRVYVQQGQLGGRLHEVDVQPGSEATINVTWALDSALSTAGGRTWLAFEDESARSEHATGESLRIARAVGARGAVVLGLRAIDGRRHVTGTYIEVDSTQPVRHGVLLADPVEPSEADLRNLGKYLAGDESLADRFRAPAEAGGGDTGPIDSGPRDTGGRPFKTWKWVTLIGGVAAVGTGVTLIAIHKDRIIDGMLQDDYRETRTPGIITAVAGGALLATSVYFWIRDGSDAKKATKAAILPTRGGGMFAISGRF
jgi:hypothetical protein